MIAAGEAVEQAGEVRFDHAPGSPAGRQVFGRVLADGMRAGAGGRGGGAYSVLATLRPPVVRRVGP